MADTTTLQAGRELDAMVAERVMGWKVVGYVDAWGECGPEEPMAEPGDHPAYVEECICEWVRQNNVEYGKDPEHGWIHGHSWQCLAIVPEHSTSVAAAWEVVEKMRERGWQLHLQGPHGGWRARFVWWGETIPVVGARPRIDPHADADTAPLAICLAAIQAVEEG